MISQDVVDGEVQLTPIQHWFFSLDFAEKHHYNQAVMLYSEQRFQEELINQSLTELAGRIYPQALQVSSIGLQSGARNYLHGSRCCHG